MFEDLLDSEGESLGCELLGALLRGRSGTLSTAESGSDCGKLSPEFELRVTNGY
jgi:hypothetical protein